MQYVIPYIQLEAAIVTTDASD